jgi:ABC-type branched-subunit amino acid transport system ATPase component
MSDMLLEATGISKRFGGVVALDHVDLSLPAAAVVSLVGPNGSGKTTLLDCLSGFTRADGGTVTFDSRNITRFSRRRRIAAGIRRTFQAAHVFEGLTLEEHLILAQQAGERSLWIEDVLRLPRVHHAVHKARVRAHDALDFVELRKAPTTLATDLSYGQQKLLGLACGLVAEPRLLCLDEPLAGVNPALAERLIPVVSRLREQGATVLIVEHNIDFVTAVSDQVVVLAEGEVVVSGPPEVLQTDERAFAALAGTNEARQ